MQFMIKLVSKKELSIITDEGSTHMPKKNLEEMNALEKIRNSIGGKTFRGMVLVSLVIGISAISLGFSLYMSSVRRTNRVNTWHMSQMAAELIDKDEVLREAAEVIRIYDSLSDEEKVLLNDKHAEILSRFDGIRGEGFDNICEVLRTVQNANEGRAAFTAFLDVENNLRVFITDSDPNATFCPPGSLDELDKDAISDLVNGRQHLLDDMFGVGKISATTINMSPYGYRCMAGTKLGEINGYPVYVFFDSDMNKAVNAGFDYLWIVVLIMLVLFNVVLVFFLKYVKKTTVEPITQLTDAAMKYIETREEDNKGGYFNDLEIHTGDEIEKLSIAMKTMESDMGKYIRNLTTITAERERISTELSLANKIQADMLPSIYPAFPDRSEFDIYATMEPAKMVGGDFYDFFLIDDDHLGIIIADVSGKGIPAALFMTICLIILKNSTMLKRSISEVLANTNEAICANNTNEMFVTVWMGILEISTGKMKCGNAGHEYPTLKKKDGKFEILRDKHGFVLGGMSHIKYSEYELQLEPGDKIYVYTDGVAEAMNGDNEMFGTDRMLDALNLEPEASAEQTIKNVRNAISEFVQDAEQFDDVTMLCMEYKGK